MKVIISFVNLNLNQNKLIIYVTVIHCICKEYDIKTGYLS